MTAVPRNHPGVNTTPLAAREREVVALAREGASMIAIGRRLGISTRAAAGLLGGARRKLAAGSRSALLALLAITGILASAPLTAAPTAAAPAVGRVPAAQFDAGDLHTCAVLGDATVRCWGFGFFGQLGYGSENNIGDDPGESPAASGPVDLGAGRTATAVDAGAIHTCARLDNGTVRCWGTGDAGRLGYGNENNVGDDPGETPGSFGPVDLGTGRTATALAAGASHTCALLDNGTVRCWGSGLLGQLGSGNQDDVGDDESPGDVDPVDLGAGRTATAITAGGGHTCALLDNGAVLCWGEASVGQLGYGDQERIGDDESPDTAGPVDLGDGRTASAVSAGAFHTCALLDNGAVRCWGFGTFGQLGYGSDETVGDEPGETPGSFGPVQLGSERTATAITAGGSHTCALLDDETVRCWGDGTTGALGYGGRDVVGDDELPPAAGPVDLGRAAAAVAAGGSHTCAVLDNGAVRCWGLGSSGQLGYGDPDTIGDDRGELPRTVGPVVLGGLVPVAPGAPVEPAAELTGPREVTVSWGEPAPGSAPTLDYEVTSDPPSSTAVTTSTSATFSGLADGTYTFSVTARNAARRGPPATSNPVVVGTGDGFTPVSPRRVLDTRAGLGAAGPLGAEAILALTVPGVPSDATAVVLNVTVTEPDRDGFLTVWPCGPSRPLASNLNFAAGESRSNLVVATRGAGGRVCFGGNATAHVVADLAGWFAPFDGTKDRYNPLAPQRLVDTRITTRLIPGAPLAFTVVGGPVPPAATAVMLNLTAVEPDAAGFLTVWPCGQPQPVVSNVNYVGGQIVPNAVAVKTSATGTVCIATFAPIDVVVDRVGWFGATGDLYRPADPVRVLDTRTGLGVPQGPLAAEATLTLSIPGRAAGATGVIVNVIATEAASDGFVTVWPCGQPRPLASTLNVTPGQPGVPNLAAVALGPGQRICLSGNIATHLVADVTGSFHP